MIQWCVYSFETSLCRHITPPSTFRLFVYEQISEKRYSEQMFIQRTNYPVCSPYLSPNPIPNKLNAESGSDCCFCVNVRISLFRTSGRSGPYQFIKSSLVTIWDSLFDQQMGVLAGFIQLIIFWTFDMKQLKGFVILVCADISSKNSVLLVMQGDSQPFHPIYTIGSTSTASSSWQISLSSQQVLLRVISSDAFPSLTQQISSVYDGALLKAQAALTTTTSGTTLTPLTIAYRTMSLICSTVQTSSSLKLPYSASSGCLSNFNGNESWPVMCQCRTFILLYIRASMVSRMIWTGRKCFEVSIIKPRNTKSGWSLVIVIGMFYSWHEKKDFLLWHLIDCVKVYSPRMNPTYVSAIIYAFSLSMLKEQVYSSGVKALFKRGSRTRAQIGYLSAAVFEFDKDDSY